jgi:ubiquinone/menaquinone biosynthesis C-methylase UbiE
MRRLADASELLDGELRDQRLLDSNLRDLRRINRVFGGAALSIRAVRALVEAAGAGAQQRGTGQAMDLRILDVGTGAADIPLALVGTRGPWRSIHVTAVDSRSEVVAAARRISPQIAGSHEVVLAVADGRSLPFADGEFDVAHASLVLHHLEPPDAAAFLAELRRVARLGIVINDLSRGVLPWLGAWIVLHAMTRNVLTLHDGPLSVRRAYTTAEAAALSREAGLNPVATIQGLAWHRWAIAAVPR